MTLTHKQIKEHAARFAERVELSDEDRCFIGRCPSFFGGGTHANDEARVYLELRALAEEWVELLHKDGAPDPASDRRQCSGRLLLRVEPDVHRRFGLKAVAAGGSPNGYCAKTFAKA